MSLFGWLRKINGELTADGILVRQNTPGRRQETVRPRLERLEDRLTPNVDTVTSVAVSISPNFFGLNANETITATVTQAGTTTPVTGGNIAFNVNNRMGTAVLNSNGQASFSTSLPLFAVGINQTLQASYQGATIGSDTFNGSAFLAPVYLNVWNTVYPSQISYGTPTSTTSFQSSGGETDDLNVFGFHLKFNYVDPGRIDTIVWVGLTFPGFYSTAFGVPQPGAVASGG